MSETYNQNSEPSKLLNAIEKDPESFLPGSRNNDLCNWVFAKMLVDKKNKETTSKADFVADFFSRVFPKLEKPQANSLKVWHRSPRELIETCYDRYYEDDAQYIRDYLFIDVFGYTLPDDTPVSAF